MRATATAWIRRSDRFGLVRTGSAMAATRGVSILSGIVLSVLLARFLGVEGYGGYLFALTIAQILAMPVLLGLPTLLMRQIAVYRAEQDKQRLRGVVRWSLLFVAVMLAIVGIGFAVVLTVNGTLSDVRNQTTWLYILAFPLVFALTFMRLASAVLQGYERPLYSSLPDGLIRPLVLLFLVGVAIGVGFLTPVWAMTLHIAAVIVALTWAVVMTFRHCDLGALLTGPTRTETTEWLSSLLPLGLLVGAALINSRLDVFMLGSLHSIESVAIYGIATQIAGIAGAAHLIPNTIIAPRIAAAHASGAKLELESLCQSACYLSVAASVAFFVTLALAGENVIAILLGPDFSDTINVALMLCAGQLLIASLGPAMIALNMMKREYSVTSAVLISAGANICLNAVLIPLYGVFGAAVATVVSSLGAQVYCATRLDKHFGIRIGPMRFLRPRRASESSGREGL